MVSLLTDLVKTYLEKLINGAIGEFRYVCCFTSIAEEFKEEQTKLETERRTVDQRVEERQKKVDQLLQEDIKTKKTCFFGFCPDCIWRYKRGKELADKIVKMKQLVKITPPLPGVEYHSSHSYIHFKGRESEYKKLLEALKDENNFITGLHGMGGSGKTTLAIKVGKELKQSGNFAHVIDVTVSYTSNIKDIQDDIAGPLGLKWEDCNESDRPKKLWSRLTNGEKILLIFDDVWDQKPPLDFDAIGIPKQDNHKGCRLLVTTRNKRLLNKMGCDEIIKLQVLSEEDSRIMFESYAGITNNSPKSLIDKGREIADECKSLPIAIAVVASSLKGQESIEEWDLALKSLRNPLSFIQSDDESLVEIYNFLKFSYDYLKDENVKRLFLLCSVFPEDKEIDVENLTRLGIGTGLFGEDYGNYNDGRNQVVVAKNKLLDSCLLLEAGKGCVKMHDLVREVAQCIANKEIRTVNMSHKDPKSLIDRDNNTKYLFWEGKAREMFSSSFGGSNLEILIVALDADGNGDCAEVPNSFFENMAGLRVLHLDYKQSSYTPLAFSLQRSIKSLMNIRSLLVCKVNLGDISVLGNLQCLETLDLSYCQITELPHEITKLEKFKLLKLTMCEIKWNNPFEVIEKCLFLDELYFYESFNKFCKEINFFPTLQRYVISGRKQDNESDVSVSKVVELDSNIFSEATLKYFFQTTEYLVLKSIKWRWRNLIPEIVPVDQGMNDVVHLELRNSLELQYLIEVVGSQVPNVFSKLVVLKLHGMEKLEELCNAPLDLCTLKIMSLSECPLLVSVFQLSTAKSLIMLEELEVLNCGKLESIIADEKSGEESKEEILVDDGDNEDKKNNSSIFPKLRFLEIGNCPLLEFILPFLSFDQLVELGSLKVLRLDGLLGIFPESMALFGKASSSTLREDFKDPTQLDPIKCNWTQKCCYGQKYKHKLRSSTSTKIPLVSKCFSRQLQILCNITAIELTEVSNIKSVFTLSTARRMMQLEFLLIGNCDELKHIIVDTGDDNVGNNSSNVFPRLTNFYVSDCEQLEYIFGHYDDYHESHNEIHLHLPKLLLLSLVDLESLVAMCPKQYHTTFPSLMTFELRHCSQVASKSIGDFISHGGSTSLDNTTIKCFSGQPQILCNITKIILTEVSNIKSVFTLSTARRMLHLETLTIDSCFKLKHIIIDTGDDNGGNNSSNVFPRLKELSVHRCKRLEYIFGHYADDHQSHNEIHLHLSELKSLKLGYMPNLVAMCPKKYHTTFPPLVNLELNSCSQVASKSIGDFISHGSSTSLDNTTIKELSGNVEHFLALETLVVTNFFGENSEIENVIILNETNGQKLNLMLNDIFLEGQHVMKYLFVGPKSSVTLHNLTKIYIERCEKLEIMFSTCVVRCFPQLYSLKIKSCKDLKHIIEEDAEDEMMSNYLPTATETCFPKLETLVVESCNKLEFVFPVSICKELHKLKSLWITEADALQEVFRSKDGDKVEIPNLKSVEFANLPSLSQTQAIQFQNVDYCRMEKCGTRSKPPTQSLSPKSKQESFKTSVEEGTMLVDAKIITSSTHSESGSLVASEHKTSSNEVGYGKISITSQTNDQRVKDGNLTAETSKDFSVGVKDQAASGRKLTSSQEFLNEPSTSQQHPVGEADTTAKPSRGNNCLEETKDQSIQKVLISEKATTTVTGSFKKSDEQETTLDNVDTATTSTPQTPYEGNPPQTLENPRSSSLLTKELQQLVSKKHLASENLTLLTDFLIKHPSVSLSENSLSNRYKGYAYSCLAELLKFLQTHSVLDVLESSHSEFVELLQDARSFDFDKNWLDGIEKRVLLPDLQHSQDALEKLFHSKQQVSQHLEDLKHQITSCEADLESIIQQEAQVLESRAALSAPLGY